MKKKVILSISGLIFLLVSVLVIVFIVNMKEEPKKITNEPIDPIINIILKNNSGAKKDNLEVQKEMVDGKYKVIDKEQSSDNKTVYYLVDKKNSKMERFTSIKMYAKP